MLPITPSLSRRPSRVARIGAAATAVVLALVSAGSFGGAGTALAAAIPGTATIQVATGPTAGQALDSGGSATQFALRPPTGAACTGDSSSGGYRVQSYMVPSSVDPATITFDASGPTPPGTGAAYRQPLFSAGTPFVNRTTGVATEANGPGLLVSLPPFDFSLFGADGPSIVPPGTYNLGFACTLGTGASQTMDRYWNVRLTFATDQTDAPSRITWTVATAPPPSTTTTIAGTTTTTTEGSTTTVADGTDTTSVTDTTDVTDTTSVTDTTDVTDTTFFVDSGAGGGGGDFDGGGELVTTGGSPWPAVGWGLLLLVLGRIVVLAARRIRIVPPES